MPLYILSLLAFLLGTMGQMSLVANALLFSGNFESGDLDDWKFSGNSTTQIVNEPVRSGDYAVAMVVSPEDEVPYRSELVVNSKNGEFIEHEEYWISLSFFIEDWGAVAPSWATIFQIHGRPHQLADGSGPDWSCEVGKNPISISTKGTELALNVVVNPDQTQLPGKAAIATEVWSEKMELGVWQDWTFRYRSSAEADGIIEAWKDGKKVYEQYGANRYFLDNCNEPATPVTYLKVGIYRQKENTSVQKLFMDEVHIYRGTDGYDAVQPPKIRISDKTPPTAPTDLVAASISENSFTVSWPPATDDVGVSEYVLYKNGQESKTVTIPTAKFSKLDPGTSYDISVEAMDEAGNVSSRSAVLTVSTLMDEVVVEPLPVAKPVATSTTPIIEPTTLPITPPETILEPENITPPPTPKPLPTPQPGPSKSPTPQAPTQQTTVDNSQSRAVITIPTEQRATTTTATEPAREEIIKSTPDTIISEPVPVPVQLFCYVVNIVFYILMTDWRCEQTPVPVNQVTKTTSNPQRDNTFLTRT
jgi:hypothetical protein